MAVSITPGPVRARRRVYRPMSEINVTPMVDVMLVLLVIFMITAPLLTVGVPVDLPQTEASPLVEPAEPLVVTVDAEGKIYLQDTETPLETLVAKLVAITDAKPDTRIFLRGDRTIAYGKIMEVMGTVNAAGLTRVALITEMPPFVARPAARPMPKPAAKPKAQ
jgi:biopolymer transport protein TolR